jgi:uncharacterized protein YndB with AHSA1/START domain
MTLIAPTIIIKKLIMNENSFNMQSFSHSVYLDKPVEKVFDYIAKCDGLSKWFIGVASYVSPEGTEREHDDYVQREDIYEWKWLKKNFSTKGEVLDVQKNELFGFTFGSLFNVTIVLKKDKGRTLFTLTQKYNADTIKDDFAHINCCVCWVFFITNLKSVIENGIDLRETLSNNEELVNR